MLYTNKQREALRELIETLILEMQDKIGTNMFKTKAKFEQLKKEGKL